MSRKLKRRLHVVLERNGQGWQILQYWYGVDGGGTRADKVRQTWSENRRHEIYDADEMTSKPGSCLWVVERKDAGEWRFVGVCKTIRDRDNAARSVDGQTRFRRFVRRRVRAW